MGITHSCTRLFGAWTGISPQHETCNDYIEMTVFEECDRVRGAGVVHPAGEFASNMECEVFGGNRYIIEGDPNAAETFACMAKVGTAGHSSERPMEGIVGAVSPELNAPGACNDGFIREDALLVLVIITDEEEKGSSGGPQQWFDTLVALKGGIETNIVTLALIGPDNPKCDSAAQVAYRIIEFTQKFTYGSVGQICADSFQPFFHDAISVIDHRSGALFHCSTPGEAPATSSRRRSGVAAITVHGSCAPRVPMMRAMYCCAVSLMTPPYRTVGGAGQPLSSGFSGSAVIWRSAQW